MVSVKEFTLPARNVDCVNGFVEKSAVFLLTFVYCCLCPLALRDVPDDGAEHSAVLDQEYPGRDLHREDRTVFLLMKTLDRAGRRNGRHPGRHFLDVRD